MIVMPGMNIDEHRMIIRNKAGLSVEFLRNGAVRHIEAAPVRISIRSADMSSGSSANIWLRRRGSDNNDMCPLTGPGSNSRFMIGPDGYVSGGEWKGIEFKCRLKLSEKETVWEWRAELHNSTGQDTACDLVLMQDVGLKTISTGPVNEYYVSQYIERRILEDPVHGKVVCCRQNMNESGCNPWLMIASLGRAVSASTDGMQFYGRSYRATGVPEGLLGDDADGEYAGESSIVALKEEPFMLPAGSSVCIRFACAFVNDHPTATSEADLIRLAGLAKEFGNESPENGREAEGGEGLTTQQAPGMSGEERYGGYITPEVNIFSAPVMLVSERLDDSGINNLFPGEKRHVEIRNGGLLSFFYGDNRHVMLRDKELLTDRPHGHIMQSGSRLVPDEGIMSTTAYGFGVFNSHLTQGNTNFGTLLSVCNSQFNINRATGQRIFVETDGRLELLGVPSAFEMGLNHCRWVYRCGSHLFQVRTWTSARAPQVNLDFQVLNGGPVAIRVSHDFDELNGWVVKPDSSTCGYSAVPASGSMVASRFPHARFRIRVQYSGNRFNFARGAVTGYGSDPGDPGPLVIETEPLSRFCVSFTGCLTADREPVLFSDAGIQFASDTTDARLRWEEMSSSLAIESRNPDIKAVTEILPWYGMNALVHLLTPYGLEQFSGAAWGTRDISQGPVELLLSMHKYPEVRKILGIVFSNQETDGGWPQWWMFDSFNDIRADGAHGDIIYWCLIALSNYIKASGDTGFLDYQLPFYEKDKTSEVDKESLRDHVDRLVKKVTGSFVPGRALVRYGGGDWNDSLQPVSSDLAERLISSWTVEMSYQAFRQYAEVCTRCGDFIRAEELSRYCEMIADDFSRYLVRDGVVAGYGYTEDDGSITPLLHPSDTVTGIKYSLLPMERGIISGIFTPAQAGFHLELIGKHLMGPDGARLMDRPLKYSGGIQNLFRRAESSTFFGREIGLMYVHEHIRYAEALARTGNAGAFVRALRQAIPVDYSAIVPSSDIRQSNCYYSSSDAVFKTRYAADEQYTLITEGRITLRGGWRVYSSGPGIFTGLVVTCLLGLRREWGRIVIDPVMPVAFDGLRATLKLSGHPVTFIYHVGEGTSGPKRIIVNGREVSFLSEDNAYRTGGAIIDENILTGLPGERSVTVDIFL
jgi:cellobiose phosphorylase